MKQNIGISVAMITYNVESILDKTLKAAVELGDEIIIVDNGSTDGTLKIVESYQKAGYNLRFFTEDWKGYGLQKNSAIEKCSNDWILSLDSDEVLSDRLIKSIKEELQAPKSHIYELRRDAVCFGKKIRFGGWSNDMSLKLFKKGSGSFDDSVVHENFITDKSVGCIKEGVIYHYTYETYEDYLSRFNKYTTQSAMELYRSGKKPRLDKIFIAPLLNFIKFYIVKLGFLDGKEGLFLGYFSGLYSFVKYSKLYEMHRRKN